MDDLRSMNQALPDVDETTYNNRHKRTGVAVILFNQTFTSRQHRFRLWAEKDKERLQQVLSNKGFDVKVFENLSVIEMQNELQRVSELDHSDSDCLLCVMSSHGTWDKGDDGQRRRDVVVGNDSYYVALKSLTDVFKNCEGLQGKPKLFLMQICRGENDMTYLERYPDTKVDNTEGPEQTRVNHDAPIHTKQTDSHDLCLPYDIPIYKDYFLHFATTQDHQSYRMPDYGSSFLQAWCDILEQYPMEDILTMSTLVNKRVPEIMSPYKKAQMPQAVSMLTKDFFFASK